MPRITNNLGLPQPIVEAVKNDPYSKGDCDFSATELIRPPYQNKLLKAHADEIEVDVADRIWSLFGQSIHGILERGAHDEYVLERRYVGQYGMPPDHVGYTVGAKIDCLHIPSMTLDDYKVTSVYKFRTNPAGFLKVPEEYEWQLNIQADCIARETGEEVRAGRIIGILRDWRRSEAMRDHGYPQFPVQIMKIPIWHPRHRLDFIESRIAAHVNASPEPCSATERWERPSMWAIMKEGGNRATKLFGDKLEAEGYMDEMDMNEKAGFSLVERPGSRTRCENYCEVSSKCPSFRAYREEKLAT